jgi:hypothetical protein
MNIFSPPYPGEKARGGDIICDDPGSASFLSAASPKWVLLLIVPRLMAGLHSLLWDDGARGCKAKILALTEMAANLGGHWQFRDFSYCGPEILKRLQLL